MDRTEPIVFSPVDPHVLYYATNLLFETTDGGRSWQTISPDLTRENPGVPASVGDQALEKSQGGKTTRCNLCGRARVPQCEYDLGRDR